MIPAAQMELIRFLGISVYGDGADYFRSLSPERREVIIQELERSKFGAWGYSKLQPVLQPDEAQKLQMLYYLGVASALKYDVLRNEIYTLFEQENIRFAPIKGADWAFEFYPQPGVRSFVDLDILIHLEDCERALALLRRNQFNPRDEERYTGFRHHHFAAYIKNGLVVEPHWTLPRFKDVDALDLWAEIAPAADGRSQHRLSPELSLFLIMRHALGSNFDYRSVCLAKLLMDAAMIVGSGQVDWLHLRELSKKWKLPYPGDILGAFPEFFPAEVIRKFEANIDNAKLFRQIFDTQDVCEVSSDADQVMAQNIYSLLWWKKRLSRFLPSRMRSKYDLPAHGQTARLIWIYLVDGSRKIGQFALMIFRRNRKMQDYFKLIERSERSYEQE